MHGGLIQGAGQTAGRCIRTERSLNRMGVEEDTAAVEDKKSTDIHGVSASSSAMKLKGRRCWLMITRNKIK
ncbi:hypothetical protein D5086_029844 [Populus alba]|uniref:Uncharacterized protein n=1 Tax=Populus alba TaxID=43335 RepID=A0ACC4AUN7_POPAL